MKIVTVVGARPQFVKASVVSIALRGIPGVREWIVHTGQHYDDMMSDVFFNELDIPRPDVNLGIHGGSHGAMTARMLSGIEQILIADRPDAVLVYGDTNSTLAGALAAAKLDIPVAHVEAGLRSFNRRMPEEVNRVLTDHVAAWLFAPTEAAVRQLRDEGIVASVHLVGDVMYDAALRFGRTTRDREGPLLDAFGLTGRSYVLATIHRQENTDCLDRLCVIAEAFKAVAADVPVVWPLHPRARQALDASGLLRGLPPQLIVTSPLGYLDMMILERHAAVIATDSGGVQKEAYFHRVPCVTVREETEWVELLDLGWNRLAPPVSGEALRDAILASVGILGRDGAPYGDGTAAARIATILCRGEINGTT